MCGIVGFTGNRQAAPILLDGLSKLEYRGYDSAGLAVRDGENLAQVVKAKGRLSNLIEKTDNGNALKGTCGIGHTRWATHGEPSQTNAHPHVSGNCSRSGSGTVESEVVGVHNGIIENYTELKEKLLKHGYTFYVFFVGRGIDYAVCLEGSLKLKEISYIHSEAYAAGELKHGTISLIEQGTLVIGVLTQSELYEKTISNMLECKSRGAYLMGLTTYGKYEIEDQVNFTVYVPKVDEHFVGSLAVIPLQLLGYYVSVAKGLDIKGWNLGKEVF